jgi:hypothetical protein
MEKTERDRYIGRVERKDAATTPTRVEVARRRRRRSPVGREGVASVRGGARATKTKSFIHQIGWEGERVQTPPERDELLGEEQPTVIFTIATVVFSTEPKRAYERALVCP